MTAEKQAAQSLVGLTLDARYRVERLLGEGGMGAVYAATDLRLDKPVAVKVMARELASNADALARFHREARVTSGLGHPNIVQVFDFSTTPGGAPFLVMEFLTGEDLDRRLRRLGRLPAAIVVHIVKQVAAALAATHAKAIVHRDLKPGNVYLLEAAGTTDFVKVLDFGISKIRTASTKLTRTASIMGTPNYMSPEQAKGKVEEIDERTDQWALACIAWECLSGEGPFVGENVPSILFQIVHEAPASLLPKVAGLPQQVEAVLLHALAKDKRERFAGVSDFATALEAAVVGERSVLRPSVEPTVHVSDATEEPHSGMTSIPATTFTQTVGELDDELDQSRSGSKKWIWAVGIGAVGLLSLGAFALFRPGPPGPAPKPVVASPAAIPSEPAAPALALPAAPPDVTAGGHSENREEVRKDPMPTPAKSVPLPGAKKAQPRSIRHSARKPSPSRIPVEENEELWH